MKELACLYEKIQCWEERKIKRELTCFPESFEGTRVSGQLEDSYDSEHLDNADQPKKKSAVENQSWKKSESVW